MPRTVVGIDVGGTFTDIAVLQDGVLAVHKLPSTPQNPSVGIAQGVAEAGVGRGRGGFRARVYRGDQCAAGGQRFADGAGHYPGLRGCIGNRTAKPGGIV